VKWKREQCVDSNEVAQFLSTLTDNQAKAAKITSKEDRGYIGYIIFYPEEERLTAMILGKNRS
jgi:hypothetical protein